MFTYCTGVLTGRSQRSFNSATTAMIVTATIRVNIRTPEVTPPTMAAVLPVSGAALGTALGTATDSPSYTCS